MRREDAVPWLAKPRARQRCRIVSTAPKLFFVAPFEEGQFYRWTFPLGVPVGRSSPVVPRPSLAVVQSLCHRSVQLLLLLPADGLTHLIDIIIARRSGPRSRATSAEQRIILPGLLPARRYVQVARRVCSAGSGTGSPKRIRIRRSDRD